MIKEESRRMCAGLDLDWASLTGLGSNGGDSVQIGLQLSLFELHGQFKSRLGQNVDSVGVGSSFHQLLSHSHLRRGTLFSG